MARTLLIGGAGFIGGWLIKALGPSDLLVFDSLSPTVHDRRSIVKFLDLDVPTIVGDITNQRDVDALVDENEFSRIVLLAAETGTARSLHACTLNADVNVLGTARILDAVARRDRFPERIVLASSRAVYGEGAYRNRAGQLVFPHPRAAEDLQAGRFEFAELTPEAMCAFDHLPNPSSIYGATKLAQENLVKNWSAGFGVKCVVLRFQNVYGSGQSPFNPYTGVLMHFLRMLAGGEPIEIYEDGGITRDFIHASDAAAALVRALEPSCPEGVFDIGSGERVALEAVAGILVQAAGGGEVRICSKYRAGDVRHACADIAAARDRMGWECRVGLDEGLSELVATSAARPAR